MAIGLSPETFGDFIRQRSRWAQGMTQILMLKNPLRQKGLKLYQRLCYLNSCIFWLFGLARIIFFVSPLMFLFFGVRLYNVGFSQVLAYTAAPLVSSYFVTNYLYGKRRHLFFSELFETIQGIFLAPAVLSAFVSPRKPKFVVTPKMLSRNNDSLTPLSAPFYVMFLLAAAGYVAGAWRWIAAPHVWDTVLICLTWNTFNFILTICCLGVVWERRQLRRSHRYATDEPVSLHLPVSAEHWPARLKDVSTTGIGITTDHSFDIPGGRLVIEARDGDQRRYILPARLMRRKVGPAGMSLGCEFAPADDAERAQIIAFVHGDSRRWKYFHENQLKGTVSSHKGFVNLLMIGAQGALRNATGVRGILLYVFNAAVNKFRRVLYEARSRRTDSRIFENAADPVLTLKPVLRRGQRVPAASPPEEITTSPRMSAPHSDARVSIHHSNPQVLEAIPESNAREKTAAS